MTTESTYELLENSIDDRGIATLRFNRPERHNALNYQLIAEASALLKTWERDPAVRCIVLRGNGRSFCSGDDVGGMSAGDKEYYDSLDFTLRREEVGYERLVKVVYDLRKPVIAALHGHVLGAGAVLALASDIRIARNDVNMGFVFVKRGITGGTTIVARYIGLGKATEMLLTGETVNGDEAERIGLVNYSVPPDDFETQVDAWAEKLASGPTKVLGIVKYNLHRGLYEDMETAIALNALASRLGNETEDSKIGRQAFKEKQVPQFTGR
jgi:2-(1,2-epoxy-1,2-dihydrophenyl)acetyl-CoA isomerase